MDKPTRSGGPPVGGSKRRRILIVDDNEDAVAMLAMLVQMLGDYDIRTARDGVEAIEAAESFRPDAMLLDLGMPRMTGYEAAARIRALPWGGDVLLVALTGWGHEVDRRRTQEAGFDRHLLKPADRASIESVLAELAGVS